MGFSEVFVATHKDALVHAGKLEAGARAGAGNVRLEAISDFEIEQLGGIAGAAVHAAGADFELTMVDVSSDSLMGVPESMVRALADLLTYEPDGDTDVLVDVAAAWAAEEDMPFGAQDAAMHVRKLAELAATVNPAERTGLYVWSD
ncbi:hypothetical protein [Pseudarthrobacter sp. PS3-L1]|uniref:hypothetical protein n=1 Tax=Pseudarthrobacter sp. PS3-L1 TaxID=3046207 RepID=UPI0024B977CA|nr:hypothetical protein [Pseudarthrobacter sp. PS3-L1]MDJ0321779.1 hypothetical protein [Pseudarthrobacter sp. PS3-L1]